MRQWQTERAGDCSVCEWDEAMIRVNKARAGCWRQGLEDMERIKSC